MTFNTGETAEDLKRLYNPEGSMLRSAQTRMLEMLLYIDDVCKQIGVEYFIEGGTALGAVRHGGFIPWDDDADIAMRRKDWKKLCRYLTSHQNGRYVLQNYKTDKHYYEQWAVLRDLNSEYIQDSNLHNIRKYKGLQVDIFPLEEGPIKFFKDLSDLFTKINDRFLAGKHPILARLCNLSQIHIVNPLGRIVSLFFGDKSSYSYVYGHNVGRPEFKSVNLFPTNPILFEGHILSGPHNPKEYCKGFFGEYMNLPKIESRNKHHAEYTIW